MKPLAKASYTILVIRNVYQKKRDKECIWESFTFSKAPHFNKFQWHIFFKGQHHGLWTFVR